MPTLDEQDLYLRNLLPSDPASGTDAPGWEAPLPLGEQSPLPAFPTHVFPAPLEAYLEGLAAQIRTPVDLPSMAVIVALSTAVAGKVRLEVAANWIEPVNVFAGIVMPPASGKSPVLKQVMRPIEAHERRLADQARTRNQEFESKRRILEERIRKVEREAANAKTDDARYAAQSDLVSLRAEERQLPWPIEPRRVTSDCTPEKLAQLMAEQGGRIAYVSSEGGIFDLMLGRYSKSGGPNIDVFLQGWSGDTIRVDRLGRGLDHVDDPALTIGVTIQPAVLEAMADQPALRGRGLPARFLWAVPDSLIGRREPNPPSLCPSWIEQYHTMMGELLQLPVPACEEQVPVLRLSPEARELFADFNTRIEPRLGERGDLGALPDWSGKLQSQLVRIATLLHVASSAGENGALQGPVGAKEMRGALEVVDYLIPHAKAAFRAMALDVQVGEALYLLRWIARHGRPSFKERDAYHGTRSRFGRIDRLRPVLRLLEDHHFIRRAQEPPRKTRGRRPTPTYLTNPIWKP